MRLLAVAFLAAALAASPGTASAHPQTISLRQYLASVSWTMRASALRIERVRMLIDDWTRVGDPPFLGGIPAACSKVRAIQADAFARIHPPPRLGTSHGWVTNSFAQARSGCKAAARFARAAIRAPGQPMSRAEARARRELPRFADTTLASFGRAVHAWRLAVLRYAASLGVSPPRWVKELG